jgi:hypothetical protein
MALNHSPSIVTNGLILCLDAANSKSYIGSGTAWNDLSGNLNNGTLVNTPTYNNTGANSSFSFNGTNQYNSIASLNLQQNFTLEIWVKQNALNGFVIFGQGTLPRATSNGLHVWYISATTIRFGMYSNDTDFTVATSTGQWYHIVITYNHTTFLKQLYINGVAQTGTTQQTQIAYAGSGQFNIGRIYSDGGNYGNGSFSNAKAYNRILTNEEVLQNFNALKGRYGL